LAISSAIIFLTSAAVSQNAPGDLERLGQFKTTGASPEIPIIPQIGPKADAIKKNLEKIMLPSGFQSAVTTFRTNQAATDGLARKPNPELSGGVA